MTTPESVSPKPTTEYFAEFFFPGILISETATRSIPDRFSVGDWPAGAYGCRTFATTVAEVDGERITGKARDYSPMTYRGGRVMTLEEVKQANDPSDRILILNMEGNGYERVYRIAGRAVPMGVNDVAEEVERV